MKRNLQLFVFFILTATYAYTQTHTGKTLNVNGNCKGYYEYLPVNYASSDNKFPLLIYCGGAGTFGNGSSNLSRLLTEGPAYFIRNNQFPSSFNVNGEASSYIIISPQFVNWPEPNDVEAVINYVLAQGYKVGNFLFPSLNGAVLIKPAYRYQAPAVPDLEPITFVVTQGAFAACVQHGGALSCKFLFLLYIKWNAAPLHQPAMRLHVLPVSINDRMIAVIVTYNMNCRVEVDVYLSIED